METNSTQKLVEKFLEGNKTRIGNYFVEGNELVYKGLTERRINFSRDKTLRLRQIKKLKEAMEAGIAFLDNSIVNQHSIEAVIKELEQDNSYRDSLWIRCLGREVLATKILHEGKTIALGNSSVLSLANEEFNTAGRRRRRSGSVSAELPIQRELAKHIPMIPFNVFLEAGLDLSKIQILERGPNETVTRIETEQVKQKDGSYKTVEHKIQTHYTGATLFKIKNKTYLFDLDRRELGFGILNPFLVELSGSPETITDAYESLKPAEVLKALGNGLKVERQGEWFFIPVSEFEHKRFEKEKPKRLTLQAGRNRPNSCEGIQIYDGKVIDQKIDPNIISNVGRSSIEEFERIQKNSQYFVTGTVRHSGREHKELKLNGWFKAIPNTATQSWTIRGDVD